MKVCIDTNAYSAFKRGEKAIAELLEAADEVLVSTVVLGELYAGFGLGALQHRNSRELRMFLDKPGVVVCAVSDEIAQHFGALLKVLRKQGTPLPTNDIWIAATALETGSRLVTLDGHFKSIPSMLIEPGA